MCLTAYAQVALPVAAAGLCALLPGGAEDGSWARRLLVGTFLRCCLSLPVHSAPSLPNPVLRCLMLPCCPRQLYAFLEGYCFATPALFGMPWIYLPVGAPQHLAGMASLA